MALTLTQQRTEIIHCGTDPVYFTNKYVKIQHPIKGLIPFSTYDYQDRCLSDFQNNRFNIVLKSRQLGLSTITAAFAIWLAIFYRDKNILVIATKLPTAINFIRKVKVALENLPGWLKMPKEISVTKSEIVFDNGSQIKAVPTSEDAGRSEALSLLIVDECVDGDTLVTVRDKITLKEQTLKIHELYNELVLQDCKNSQFEVLTQNSWSDFDGIKQSIRHEIYECIFDDNTILRCTSEHRILNNKNIFEYVKDIQLGFNTSTNKTLIKKTFRYASTQVFDLINVHDQNQYLTNNIVSHNCAFVRDFATIWTGLLPTLSEGGSAILLSTPNGTVGVGKQYYSIWTEAESNQNDFNPIRLEWNVHPEHDQKWFEKEKRNLGDPKRIAQELLCSFLASGDTYLQPEDLEHVRVQIKDPIQKDEEGKLWIWKHPDPDKRYVISADVARGDSKDYSAFHIFDYDDFEVVAEYMKKIPPDRFGEVLIKWGTTYNNAVLIPEKNNIGYMTNVKIKDAKYPKLFYKDVKTDIFSENYAPSNPDDIPGFDTQQKSRVQILSKLEEVIRNKQLKIYSRRLYEQLKTFVWNNGKAQADRDSNDDLVLSAAIGCWIVGSTSNVLTNDDSEMLYAILKATSTNSNNHSAIDSINAIKPFVAPAILGSNPNSVYRPRTAENVQQQNPRLGGLFDYRWLYR